MKKQVLSIEQMQELKELGIDTSKAGAMWTYFKDNNLYFPTFIGGKEDIRENDIPTFTLQDILEMLPREVKEHHFILEDNYDEWDMYYFLSDSDNPIHTIGNITGKTFLEAAFNMLKWCKQNNYI